MTRNAASGASTPRRRRGRSRPDGAPTGPDEVRRAVLDAAADLFARCGVDQVSMRDIAAAADVQLSLINRYFGSRAQLVLAVFDDLSATLAREVLDRPLLQVSFERDSAMGRWTRVLCHLVLTGADLHAAAASFNAVQALAQVVEHEYGTAGTAGRLRAAQIVASALGWRIFEEYLVAAGGLDAIPTAELRDDLTAAHRRLGATPWPSPSDPPTR